MSVIKTVGTVGSVKFPRIKKPSIDLSSLMMNDLGINRGIILKKDSVYIPSSIEKWGKRYS